MVTILNCDITIQELLEIAKVKAIAWPKYTQNDHVVWMLQNLSDHDLHCMYRTNQIEAYMNIMPIELTLNDIKSEAYGMGNLCALHNGRAYGSLLMKQALNKVKETGLPALSFCNYDMMTYYRSMGWHFIHRSKLWMPEIDLQDIRVMVYNCEVTSLEYYGKKL